MSLSRKGIEDLKLYVPGRPIDEVKKQYGIDDVIKLASNENPLGASPAAVRAIIEAASNVNMYPDPISAKLCERLSKNLNVQPSQIMVSNGMDNVLLLITEAFVNEGDEVLTCAPSFDTYRISTIVMGGKFKTVPLKNHRFDLNALADAITEKTKMVFVCNPNNPTGTIVTKAEVEEFMAKIPTHVIVVFDEAYYEFVDNTEYAQGMKYVHENRNVIVGRTFSKLYGLAGTRVGYAIAPAHIMNILKRTLAPFPVNILGQAAALAAADDFEFIENTLKLNRAGKEYLMAEFAKLGFDSSDANGNFIWTDTHRDGRELEQKLLQRGIIIRAGYLWGFDTHLRVSIGTLEQCERLIKTLKEIL
ncbi:MAG: histidinol-phosphate transaminase [Clostridiales bacterium]|nr:histidinol-phosphate transaminase [Clostridiales bacterium]